MKDHPGLHHKYIINTLLIILDTTDLSLILQDMINMEHHFQYWKHQKYLILKLNISITMLKLYQILSLKDSTNLIIPHKKNMNIITAGENTCNL
ncbi:hypothetical protein O3M35_012185 [Rhynocoris fuscipes]|uniref:Uncharacterized protein n=1 Tax=Rhynocoris fuscipes TaxID=488301 RepID=A0AAW1CSB4_9HEMI